MRPLWTVAWAIGVGLSLGGCGTQNPVPVGAPRPSVVEAKPEPKKGVPAPVEANKVQAAPPEEFVYSPAGLRDPFEPFIKLEPEKGKKQAPKVFVPKTPLQRYPAEELKLVGVVWSGTPLKPKALVEDPTGKGYVVMVGTLVGDKGGGIIQIAPDLVTVEERFLGILGEETVRVVKMTLHKPDGEVKQ